MEKLLGAYTHPTVLNSSKSWMPTSDSVSRSDVEQADHLERAEKRDAARYRYERLYWESTPEDGRVSYFLIEIFYQFVELIICRNLCYLVFWRMLRRGCI